MCCFINLRLSNVDINKPARGDNYRAIALSPELKYLLAADLLMIYILVNKGG